MTASVAKIRLPVLKVDPLWLALGLTASAFAAWGAVFARAWALFHTFGPICGNGVLHCPLCPPAAALTVAAAAALVWAYVDAGRPAVPDTAA